MPPFDDDVDARAARRPHAKRDAAFMKACTERIHTVQLIAGVLERHFRPGS